jgi:electron transfer flavoprotein beta subunit
MHIVVPLKQVPDLVEEIEFNADGTDIDREAAKFQLSEWDDQALEEALLLKEATGGQVTVITPGGGEADQVLFTCLAKGADRAVKLTGDFPPKMDHHSLAQILADAIRQLDAKLILTGVQSVEDMDGQVAVLLAGYLGVPHVSVVTGVEVSGDRVSVKQEYSGGVMAELEIALPAVIGVQAARQAPRYAPVSKVRQLAKTAKLEEIAVQPKPQASGLKILRLFKPTATGRAQMLEGEPEEVAGKLVEILKERGLGR